MQTIDLTDQQFGRLKVLEKAGQLPIGKSKTLRNFWFCECACGTWTLTSTNNLRNGSTVSCGCHKAELAADYCKTEEHLSRIRTHGMSETSEYHTWKQMKQDHPHVAAWEDFQQFIFDIGQRPTPDHVLGRRDVREQHGPLNTYWRHKNDESNRRRHLELADDLGFDLGDILVTATAAAA